MAKKEEGKITVTVQQQPVLQPTSVERVAVDNSYHVDVPAGHVYIVSLDGQGNEKPNSGFFYPEKNHLKYYGDTSKFLVKKKGNLLK